MIGGGRKAQPGEVTLAHHGVLFLDELPEFDRRVLEALREPLETGVATIARADWRAEYPASFQLIAAMNPCPCGHKGDATKDCRCSSTRIASYRSRLSGPLLDRIDLRVELSAVAAHELLFDASAARSELGVIAAKQAEVRESIAAARERQLARCGTLNAKLGPKAIETTCVLEPAARRCLVSGHERLQLSARGLHRTVKVARTIADLEGDEVVGVAHIAEALQLRRALEAPLECAKRA
jgi:magnesium chelatase family protein